MVRAFFVSIFETMLHLQTKLKLSPFATSMQVGDRILTMGSCFADRIGEYLTDYKFETLVNPFGVIFNPVSLCTLLISQEANGDKFVNREGLSCHYDYHFDLRGAQQEDLAARIKYLHEQSAACLKKANWLILTFGTAHVHELKDGRGVVANCHKVPQKEFEKRLLDLEEMQGAFANMKDYFKSINPKLKIILTVSPVRHIKDGIAENQLSKSLLRVLCSQLANDSDVFYFPSYEIMVDELRDYRFYKEDMIHPTAQAEAYIWECFQQVAMDQETIDFIKEWKTVQSAMQHKAFNSESEAHQKFLQSMIEKAKSLSGKVDTSMELEYFQNQKIAK